MPRASEHWREPVHRLWDELADFDRADSDGALDLLLATLSELIEAQNAWWLGAVRVGSSNSGDPLHNWRPGAIRYLHESPVDRRFYKSSQVEIACGAVDESTLASMRDAGTFRVLWLPEIVSPAWYETPFYTLAYRARGIHDAVFVGCPVNRDAECIYGFHRKGSNRAPFRPADRRVLAYALRSLRWFQRHILLDRGLLVARNPLTETERRVLHHLLSGIPENDIAAAAGIARATTHNHITSIYRKFSVNSRAELMALWLGHNGS